jgi:hypothetical protein
VGGRRTGRVAGSCSPATASAPARPRMEPERYWHLPTRLPRPSTDTEPVRAALEESVRQHLISDVPLGVSSRAPGASPSNSAQNTTSFASRSRFSGATSTML